MSGETELSGRRSQRRTNVVFLLGRMEVPVTVDELVDELRRHAERQPGGPATDESWADLHERLHEEDLPALDRAGLLAFDPERGIVTEARSPENGPFAPDMETETGGDGAAHTDDASTGGTAARYQLVLALLVTAALVATSLGFGPFADFSRDRVATALVVVMVAASVVSAFSYRR
jgi:hypothetical protein